MTTLEALIADAIHGALDNHQIRIKALDERRLITDAIEHISLAGYTLQLIPKDTP